MAIDHPREHRKFGRRSVFKQAEVVFDDGRRMKATVLDVSDGGAKIKVSESEMLPEDFCLEMPSDDMIVRCRGVRLESGVIGLKYVKPPRRLSWMKK